MVQKLQYLPLEYTREDEIVLVSDLPENPDPRLCLIDSPPSGVLETWGASLAVAKWAAQHNILYEMPDWEVVKKVNSKVFSFQESPQLKGAALLTHPSEVAAWIKESSGPKVLKTPQGFAGRGHFHIGRNDLSTFLAQNPLVIGEPWVERTFDFSTQWKIDGTVEYLGATILKNKPNGTYLSNQVWTDCKTYDWALQMHFEIANPIVEKIKKLGYFGNLGIDAFVYLRDGVEKLHPIVEINARKTMGWVVLYKNSN